MRQLQQNRCAFRQPYLLSSYNTPFTIQIAIQIAVWSPLTHRPQSRARCASILLVKMASIPPTTSHPSPCHLKFIRPCKTQHGLKSVNSLVVFKFQQPYPRYRIYVEHPTLVIEPLPKNTTLSTGPVCLCNRCTHWCLRDPKGRVSAGRADMDIDAR